MTDKTSRGTQAIDRALDILELIASKGAVSLPGITEEGGLTAPTAYRLVKSLTRRGFVSYNEATKLYSLGPAIMRMAAGMLRGNTFVELVRPAMDRLAMLSGETVSLFTVGMTELMCVAGVESMQRLHVNSGIGRAIQMAQGAPGRAAAAWLDAGRNALFYKRAGLTKAAIRELEEELARVREQGFARSFGEVAPETSAVSVPVFDGPGQVVGVISIAGPEGRWTCDEMDRIIPAMLKEAEGITAQLGGQPRRPTRTVRAVEG
ncbi:MAG: IclR family transcriptional regulator [Paracoccus sp. (in: a-proteobacteria)]|uniref:IclR family transcriptional regulator n=1 Tax=Paracoccus sp. TaxID=267 RepID=UPI0039E2B0D2